MGICLIPRTFLACNAKYVADAKRGLVLDRQKLHLKGNKLVRMARERRRYCVDADPEIWFKRTDSLRLFLNTIGYPRLEAMDFTVSEGAEHIHDLNDKVPKALQNQFDLIIDGGTTEHVSHIGTALENCHTMLNPGGIMMSFVAAEGGHGFLPTGPDVPLTCWHHCSA